MQDEEKIKIDGVDCINVKILPGDGNKSEDDFINQFSDEPLKESPEDKTKLKNIISYLKSERFKKKINSVAYEKGIPPKQVAKGVISKMFGIVGDILGIAVETTYCTLSGLLDLLNTILQKGLDLIAKVVRSITKIITFNQTTII